jgi:hypothetical protein
MLIPVRLFPTALILFSVILFSTYPVQHWDYL